MRLNPIIQIFTGQHIDLSKVLSIGNAIDKPRCSIYFYIYFQLQDKPVAFYCPETGDHDKAIDAPGTSEFFKGREYEIKTFQSQIDELIEVWKKFYEKDDAKETQ